MRLYSSLLADEWCPRKKYGHHLSPEAPRLVGFMCGNEAHDGCLTLDENVRIHSCQKGSYCEALKAASQKNLVVWIRPCIAHLTDGRDILEAGVGGGGSDLVRDAELEDISAEDVSDFLAM